MAVAVLGTQTIALRKGEVLLELGNRSDLDTGSPSRLDIWYRDAYLSLCQAYDFEGLEFTQAPQLSNSPSLIWPAQARAIKSMTITDSSGTVSYPDHKDINTIRKTQATSVPGKPSLYCVFGNPALILFAPTADAGPYTVTMDLWSRALFDQTTLSATPLLLPDDWMEVLDYQVMIRGHARLGEPDKAAALQQLLYGYTNPATGQYTPGLIYNLQLRRQANAPSRDYGLQPRSLRVKHV